MGRTTTNLDMQFADGPSIADSFLFFVEKNDSFKTYVCFQPDDDGSIPVTIGRVDWGWYGEAYNTNGLWQLDRASAITGPALDSSDDSFPQWPNVFNNSP
jgi:hypothetical protein